MSILPNSEEAFTFPTNILPYEGRGRGGIGVKLRVAEACKILNGELRNSPELMVRKRKIFSRARGESK